MKIRSLVSPLLAAVGLLLATPASATTFNLTAALDCAQANAGAGTCGAGGSGTGNATITYDDVTNLLSWSLSYSGLSGTVTAAHFHGPALPGQNAGIEVGIGTANPSISSATITDAQETDLLAGLWYINVHSTTFTGGEIRGQVTVPEPSTVAILGGAVLALAVLRRR